MKDIAVTQGNLTVNSISLIINHDDVKIYDIDLKDKHAEVSFYGGDENSLELGLQPYNEEIVDEADITLISFYIPDSTGWRILANCQKYSVRVVLYKSPSTELWSTTYIVAKNCESCQKTKDAVIAIKGV